jgi:GT2 family glycosyltransferase
VRPDGYEAMETWDVAIAHPAEILMGACILARRAALEAVGGFEESYFMYSEEVDLCHKLRAAGWDLYWVPQAQVVHYGGQSTRLAATEMFLQLYRAKIAYFRRHSGRFSAWVYKLILAGAALLRLAGGALAPLQSQDNRRKSLAIAQNYARLLVHLPGM